MPPVAGGAAAAQQTLLMKQFFSAMDQLSMRSVAKLDLEHPEQDYERWSLELIEITKRAGPGALEALLLAVGTYAETFAAGLYEYADFKKFTNWDVVVGAQGATDYAATGKQEACPQRPLNDWTGLDSMLSPVVCLLTLLICQFALPNSDHPWFTPNPNAGDPEEAETSKDQESAMA